MNTGSDDQNHGNNLCKIQITFSSKILNIKEKLGTKLADR